jgi:hypothetical protein
MEQSQLDFYSLDKRVSILEINNSKIDLRVDEVINAVNKLSENLSVLVAKLDTSVKVALAIFSITATLTAGFFAYTTYNETKFVQVNSHQHEQILNENK